MQKSQFRLLAKKKFLPTFLVQFLGAFNDNVFKNAMVILIAYRSMEFAGISSGIMVSLAAGIFILPFFLCSATAGQIADKYEKASLIRKIKFAEIIIMLIGSFALAYENPLLLLFTLFMLGIQAAFFGPLKYSILPDHLKRHELIGGNALVSGSTFIAILLGTIFGGLLILKDNGAVIISSYIILIAVAGWFASFYIPYARPAAKNISINMNFFSSTWRMMNVVRGDKEVRHTIYAISWFWFIGATFLAQFPNFVKQRIGGNEEIVTLFLTAFSIGIALGSMLCNKLVQKNSGTRIVFYGAAGITLFTLDLVFVSNGLALPEGMLIGLGEFINHDKFMRIFFDLMLISVCGGLYIVPLYTAMQSKSRASVRARTVAANNVINSMAMVISAVFTIVMFAYKLSVVDIFLAVAMFNALATILVRKLKVD